MTFVVVYHRLVVEEDIPKLASVAKERIREAIQAKLVIAPADFGVPLRRSLGGYRKLRVGDYRVIFRIEGLMIKIFIIQHRSVVYKQAVKRLS